MAQSTLLAENLRLTTYMDVSVASVLVYSYLLSLPEEIEYLWTRRGMGMGKVLFVLTRYLPFVSMPLMIRSQLFPGLNMETCNSLFYAYSVVELVSLVSSECLFFLRTYIMWNCRRSILHTVWALVLMGLVPFAVLVAFFLSTVTYAISPDQELPGCIVVKSSPNTLFGAFVILLVVELVISSLIAIRVVQDRPRFGLLKAVISGGAIYSLCMTLFSIVNVVTSVVPGVAMHVFYSYQATFHAVLASHLQLRLASAQELMLPNTSTRISTIQFGRRRPENHSYELDSITRE